VYVDFPIVDLVESVMGEESCFSTVGIKAYLLTEAVQAPAL
jgi:hypothetical protein